MNFRRPLAAALCLMTLAACTGTKDLTITSAPEGANVRINGKPVGVTPVTTEVKQDKDLGIVVQKPGYEVASRTLKTKSNFWLGLIWAQNDPKALYIDEDEVYVVLRPIPSLTNYSPGTLPEYTGGKGRTTDLFSKKPKTTGSKSTDAAPPKLKPLPELH